MNWVGVATIGIAIVQAIIYQRRLEARDDRARASDAFDRLSFWLLLALYAAINIAAPWAASA
jgi:hypothetical protein